MDKEINLRKRIEELRELIISEGSLMHSKVIKASQDLDKVLNEYKRVINWYIYINLGH